MHFLSPRSRRWFMSGFLFLSAALSGCATQTYSVSQHRTAGLPAQAELKQTPFFPQEDYQCGPAALAMSLGDNGIRVDPDSLVSQVYLPKRKGSLQLEMLATARRQGAISVTIPGALTALLAEVAAGRPVVVLQNLGLSFSPLWHYAVVVGYDLDRSEIILRSGTTERLVMPMSTFEHTWARSQHWAMVSLAPGQLPHTVDADAMAAALIAFERDNQSLPVYQSYAAALARWPDHPSLLMGAGNAAFALQDYSAAEKHFAIASQRNPESAATLNNLALTLAHLGRFDEARQAANQALALRSTWTSVINATLKTIDDLQATLSATPRSN